MVEREYDTIDWVVIAMDLTLAVPTTASRAQNRLKIEVAPNGELLCHTCTSNLGKLQLAPGTRAGRLAQSRGHMTEASMAN